MNIKKEIFKAKKSIVINFLLSLAPIAFFWVLLPSGFLISQITTTIVFTYLFIRVSMKEFIFIKWLKEYQKELEKVEKTETK